MSIKVTDTNLVIIEKNNTIKVYTLKEYTKLKRDNKIITTDAPSGAIRGWVKYLVVNCPLPVVVTVDIVSENDNVNTTPANDDNEECQLCTCSRDATEITVNGKAIPIWTDEEEHTLEENTGVKFKVGDTISFKATSSTAHGVSIRFDDMLVNTGDNFDNTKSLETLQNEVLVELKERITINNEENLSNNFVALENDIINFHGGIPITFESQLTINPIQFPDGTIIASITIKEGTEGKSGTLSCTEHGIGMSFRFEICSI